MLYFRADIRRGALKFMISGTNWIMKASGSLEAGFTRENSERRKAKGRDFRRRNFLVALGRLGSGNFRTGIKIPEQS